MCVVCCNQQQSIGILRRLDFFLPTQVRAVRVEQQQWIRSANKWSRWMWTTTWDRYPGCSWSDYWVTASMCSRKKIEKHILVGGLNPSEKYSISQLGWLFPIDGKKCTKPPTRYSLLYLHSNVAMLVSLVSIIPKVARMELHASLRVGKHTISKTIQNIYFGSSWLVFRCVFSRLYLSFLLGTLNIVFLSLVWIKSQLYHIWGIWTF